LKNLNKKTIISFGITFLSFLPLVSESVEKDLTKKLLSRNKLNLNTFVISKSTLKEVLIKDKINIPNIFGNMIVEEPLKLKEPKKFELEIDSDKSYQVDGIFVAEGNVVLRLRNGILKTDKFVYNRENNLIKAEGNVVFTKGNQYFSASFLEYDLANERGFINDIYGILNFKRFDKDLNLENEIFVEKDCDSEYYDLNNLPTDIALIDAGNINLRNKLGLQAFKVDFRKIKNWRFKSEKINIYPNSWDSELIFFTNDPYNKPQFLIKSKKFSGEIKNNKTKLNSKSTYITFDNFITLPIGSRTIKDSESKSKWGFGYEKKDKDGFYISRNFQEILLENGFEVKFEPYFLIQRGFEDKTNAFRDKNTSVTSSNVESNVDFLDYFSLNSNIKGKLFQSALSVNALLKTFNPNKSYDAFSGDFNLTRNLLKSEKSHNEEILNLCDDRYENKNYLKQYKLDLGFYGAFEKDNIYTSLGAKVISEYDLLKYTNNLNFTAVFDASNHQGVSRDNNDLINLNRYGWTSSFTYNYKIFSNDINQLNYDSTYRYTPSVMAKGLFLETNLSSGYRHYSDNTSQSVIRLGLGTKLIFGDFKKRFLDYTSILILPEYAFKKGASPFRFDDFNEDSIIKIAFEQQLLGPLLLKTETSLNINTESKNYGKFENARYSMGINRRVYSISLSYNKEAETIFFNINLFNLDNSEISPIFN
tara:strand:+ start:222 stop:2330 length:2109 start_codon:yes stop_codon:yes gene_type:complete